MSQVKSHTGCSRFTSLNPLIIHFDQTDLSVLVILLFVLGKEITCGKISNPVYGQVSLSGNTTGSTAKYSCHSGFILRGVDKRACEPDGHWSDKAPVCEKCE